MALLAMMLISASAFAGSSLEKSSANAAGAVSAGISVGYITYSEITDKDGEAVELPDPMAHIPIVLGVNYGIMENLDAGVALFFEQRSQGDASGFGMREAVIGVGYEVAGAYITAGFKLDLGKKPADLATDGTEMGTSNNQNGIAIGVHYNHSLSDTMGLHVGLGVVHSLGDGEDTATANGLILDPNVGIDYSLGGGMSAGLDVGYVIVGETKFDGNAVTDSGSSALYVTPWFATGVAGGDLSVAIGGHMEDMHSGIVLMGKNMPKMPLGATVGWSKSF
jgi:hypothetical protein